MFELNLNYWAILACAPAQAIIGMLWFSKKMFGKPWMALVGLNEESIKKGNPMKSIGLSVLGSLGTAYAVSFVLFATGAVTLFEGLQVGLLVWTGFIAIVRLNDVLFAKQPFMLFLIDSGYNLAVLLAMSVLLTLWP